MSTSPPPPTDDEPQGCMETFSSLGLAAYTLLILGICISSCLCGGLTLNTAVLNMATPKELKGASEVDAWRTSELQRYGVLQDGEALLLYHDHTSMGDGRSGCLVLEEEVLVRWDDEVETARVPIAGSTVEEAEDGEVIVTLGEQQVRCPFDEGEGGDRFARMLRASSQP